MDDDRFRCELCWEEFDSPGALAEHEQLEEDTLSVLGGDNVVVAIR